MPSNTGLPRPLRSRGAPGGALRLARLGQDERGRGPGRGVQGDVRGLAARPDDAGEGAERDDDERDHRVVDDPRAAHRRGVARERGVGVAHAVNPD